ncbi:MAG: hypothetical protein HZB42_12405 [Sphingobacteriales bacterium]|nr:hypothetical protein [Sphingobacteriales bacterium]
MKYKYSTGLITAIFFVYCCHAQKGVEGAPVTVQVLPKVAASGQAVQITGNVMVHNKAQSVSIKITNPKGQLETVPVTTALTGAFTKTFTNTQQQGWYSIKVIAADGKGQGTDSFYVTTAQGVAASYKDRMLTLQSLATKNIDAVISRLDKIESSPQLEANKEKLKQARQKIGELRNKTEEMNQSFGKLVKEVSGVPGSDGLMQAHNQQLDSWQQEADKKIPTIQNQITSFENISTTCENYNNLIELCNLVSWILNFQGSFAKIMINIASDKVLPGAVDKMNIQGNPTEKETKKLAINEAQKGMTAAALGFNEIKDFMTKGLLTDVVQYVAKVLYAQKCTDLKGPAKTRFVANIYNGVDKYWTYAVEFTGTLVLRYEKNADLSKPSEITGEFEGYRTKYEFWEDIEKVEPFPKGAMILKRFSRTPTPINASSISGDLGLAGRTAVPGSYLVKVKGKIINNTLSLEVQNSMFDNMETEEKNKLFLVMVNPILPIPIIKTFDFPIARSRAAFVVGLGQNNKMPLQKTGNIIKVKQKLTNTREPDAEIKLTSTIDLDLSN